MGFSPSKLSPACKVRRRFRLLAAHLPFISCLIRVQDPHGHMSRDFWVCPLQQTPKFDRLTPVLFQVAPLGFALLGFSRLLALVPKYLLSCA